MKKLVLILLLAALSLPVAATAEDAVLTFDIGTLTPLELPAQSDGLAALYCGPTQGFYRDGEQTLDTGAPFVYFGQFDCWAMVASGTLEAMGPIGWVEAAAIDAPYDPQLGFDDSLSVMVEDDTFLTVEPLAQTPTPLCEIARGTQVILLAQYEGWGYVQTEIDGMPARAFLPLSAIL